MRVLVACEFSGVVRDAFRARGHDAVSCDLLPSEAPGAHMQGDVLDIIAGSDFDLLIAHPPCTYLSRAGARWWKRPERAALADAAASFVFALRDCGIPRICIENPVGQLNTRWRYPDQTIQPWQFGHPFSKATCLWLTNLPLLRPTDICSDYTPLLTSGGGHPGLAGLARTGHARSKTFPGVAAAMADQWSALDSVSVAA